MCVRAARRNNICIKGGKTPYFQIHHADCIKLLAGRGINICAEVRSLSTVMQPHSVYSKHNKFLLSFYWKLQENQTY